MTRSFLALLISCFTIAGCASLPPASSAPEFYIAYAGAKETRLLTTTDGLSLFGQWWLPEDTQPRAVIILLHATAAHGGVYARWANHLVSHGYAMFAYDMRGWGQSQGHGRAGFTPSPDAHVNDLALAFAEVARRYPGTPVYLQGESLGATVALQWDIRGGDEADGLILNAPPVVINLKIGPLRQPDWLSNAFAWQAGLLGQVAPNAPIYTMAGRRGRWMWNKAIFDSRSREWVTSEMNMTHSAVAASYLSSLHAATAEIREHLDDIDKPMIILQGSKDYLVSATAARRLVDESASDDVEWHLYEGRSHCALHDAAKEDIWQDIVVWLDRMSGTHQDTRLSDSSTRALH